MKPHSPAQLVNQKNSLEQLIYLLFEDKQRSSVSFLFCEMKLITSCCVLNPVNHTRLLTNALILYLRIHRAQLDELKSQSSVKRFKE